MCKYYCFCFISFNVSEPFYFNFESLRFKEDTCMILILLFEHQSEACFCNKTYFTNASNKYLLGFFNREGDVTVHCILEVMCRTY